MVGLLPVFSTNATSAVPIPDVQLPALDNTMGAAFIGTVIAASLHGVSCVQAWYYFTHQKDGWDTKILVAATMFFDTVHQALISHTVYTYVITGFDRPSQLNLLVWSLLVEVIFNGLTALLVQCFLTKRVWELSKQNVYLTGSVLALVFSEFACVIAYVSKALGFTTFMELGQLKALSIAVNALGAAGDVLIAGSLCTLLHFSRTGFRKSDTMINKLIAFSVNTGLLTSVCAIASLISIVVAPNTFLYIAFFFCLGRLYTNSLLASLNARKSIRKAAEGVNSTDDEIPHLCSVSGWFPSRHNRAGTFQRSFASPTSSHPGPQQNISIKIDTTKELTSDRDSDGGHDGPLTHSDSEAALSGISPSDKNGHLFDEQT